MHTLVMPNRNLTTPGMMELSQRFLGTRIFTSTKFTDDLHQMPKRSDRTTQLLAQNSASISL